MKKQSKVTNELTNDVQMNLQKIKKYQSTFYKKKKMYVSAITQLLCLKKKKEKNISKVK